MEPCSREAPAIRAIHHINILMSITLVYRIIKNLKLPLVTSELEEMYAPFADAFLDNAPLTVSSRSSGKK